MQWFQSANFYIMCKSKSQIWIRDAMETKRVVKFVNDFSLFHLDFDFRISDIGQK